MKTPLPVLPCLPFSIAGDIPNHRGWLYASTAGSSDTLLVLAHGAGAGHASPFMTRYAQALAARGVDVATFNFAYLERGRRLPDRAAVLEDTFRRAVQGAAAIRPLARRVFVGGKSMGGRMATHLAAAPAQWPSDVPALIGVVVFGYPLVPPGGRRSGDRVSHLRAIEVPTRIVQGTRDAFGGPDDVRQAVGPGTTIEVVEVPGADHSLEVLKSSGIMAEAVHTGVQDAVAAWLLGIGR